MKKLLLLAFTTGFLQVAIAQTFDEWFRQRRTARRYLHEQIAALNTYLDHLSKGYHIAQEGLSLIGNTKWADFLLHSDYFLSLANVKPWLYNSKLLQELSVLQADLINKLALARHSITSTSYLSSGETTWLLGILDRLGEHMRQDAGILLTVLAPGLCMTDDERLARFQEIYRSVSKDYAFLKSFCLETNALVRQRESEISGIEYLRKNQGL